MILASRLQPFTYVAVLSVLTCVPLAAVIVDRIAIVVGDKVITDSEIDQRVRLSTFQNHEKPDLTPEIRQKAAQELVDQKLVEHEMDLGHYPRMDGERRRALIENYLKTEFGGDSAAFDQALTQAHLNRDELAGDLAWQSDLLSFLDLRIRPAVQVSDDDLAKYPVEKRQEMAQKLAAERSDRELDRWLQDQHMRTRIDYLEKDLEPARK